MLRIIPIDEGVKSLLVEVIGSASSRGPEKSHSGSRQVIHLYGFKRMIVSYLWSSANNMILVMSTVMLILALINKNMFVQ
jgi:hypothetical protein